MSSSAAPIRPAKTIATSRAWRCCSPASGERSRRHDQPPLRLRHGSRRHGRPRHRLRRIDLLIAGGVESMSRAPFVMAKADTAFSRTAEIHDTTIGWRFVNPRMKQTVRHRLHAGNRRKRRARNSPSSREDSGRLRSAQPAARRTRRKPTGFFAEEIVPVEIPGKKGANRRRSRRASAPRHHT